MNKTQTTSGKKESAIREWQKDRIEMANMVSKHILDPMMSFAELVRGYDQGNGIDFNMEEISDILRLLVIGGHIEMMTYCIDGGSLSHITWNCIEEEVRKWADMTEGGAE